MRRAFTVIEFMVATSILVALVFSVAAAWPYVREVEQKRKTADHARSTFSVGAKVVVRSSSIYGTVVDVWYRSPAVFAVRVDNGPEARPRYSEVRFTGAELELADVEAAKP